MIREKRIYMKIIVFCPANTATGGPEALHQLCYCLRDLGYNAEMYYYGYKKQLNQSPLCTCYAHYGNPFSTTYIDSEENICIVPETVTKEFWKIKKGIKVLWWLSVDNYKNAINSTHGHILKNKYLQSVLHKIKYFEHRLYDPTKNDIAFHLVQSEYAKSYCHSLNIPAIKIHYVSDYLNDSYLLRARENKKIPKENRVLFNPKKGYEFTKLLINEAPEIEWTPLINLSYDEVVDLMQRSKVYIDFGNHPGKDRLPREAAVNGCCIITGKRGSAAYQEDVDIPAGFKFEDRKELTREIIQTIHQIFDSYEEISPQFDKYREEIFRGPQKFEADVRSSFLAIEEYYRKR